MNKCINLKEMVPLMKEQIDSGKEVSFVPRGKSMRPMLEGGKDMIILRKPGEKLHLFDVALYYRAETDSYVVHRLVGFQKDGSYVFLGDNNFQREYNISHSDIVGVVCKYYHKGRVREVTSFSYKVYCDFWFYTRPIRLLWLRSKLSLKKRLKKGDNLED